MKVVTLLFLATALAVTRAGGVGGAAAVQARPNSLWYRVEVRVRIDIDWAPVESPVHPGERSWTHRSTTWAGESNTAVILTRVGSGRDFRFQAAITGDLLQHTGEIRSLVDVPRSPDAPRGYCVLRELERESPKEGRRVVFGVAESSSMAIDGLHLSAQFGVRGATQSSWKTRYCHPADLPKPSDVPWTPCECGTLVKGDTETDHFWSRHFRFAAGGFGSDSIQRGRTVVRTFKAPTVTETVTYQIALYRCADQDLAKDCEV